MTDWSQLAAKHAGLNDINTLLVVSIIAAESSGNPWQVRYEKDWRYLNQPGIFAVKIGGGYSEGTERIMQSMSWGLMQVMGTVARERGFREHLHKLSDPELGIQFGCLQLRYLFNKFGDEETEHVVAAYNGGVGVVRFPNGLYKNQSYVDKVMAFLRT